MRHCRPQQDDPRYVYVVCWYLGKARPTGQGPWRRVVSRWRTYRSLTMALSRARRINDRRRVWIEKKGQPACQL